MEPNSSNELTEKSSSNVVPTLKSKKRKALSQRIRFEVFKRDKFKCKYCGKTAEENVILHVDHVIPVAKGGDNDLMNLVTACKNCNAGKSDVPLSDNEVAKKTREEAERRQELQKQLEMMAKWRLSLRESKQATIDSITEYWIEATNSFKSDELIQNAKKWLRTYSPDECLEGIDIAVDQYIEWDDEYPTDDSLQLALGKVYGILRFRKRIKEDPTLEELYKIRAIARKRCPRYFLDYEALEALKSARADGIEDEALRNAAFNCTSYTSFMNDIEYYRNLAKKQNEKEIKKTNTADKYISRARNELSNARSKMAIEYVKSKYFWEIASEKAVFCDCCNKIVSATEASIESKVENGITIYRVKCWEEECSDETGFESCISSPYDITDRGDPQYFSNSLADEILEPNIDRASLSEVIKRIGIIGYDLAFRFFPQLLSEQRIMSRGSESLKIWQTMKLMGLVTVSEIPGVDMGYHPAQGEVPPEFR